MSSMCLAATVAKCDFCRYMILRIHWLRSYNQALSHSLMQGYSRKLKGKQLGLNRLMNCTNLQQKCIALKLF
jgi:hypothetical protein